MRSSGSSGPRRGRASALAATVAAITVVSPALAGEPSGDQARRLEHLLRHDCGSCHGMTMKGGLGPALLPADLKDRDEDGLVQMILFGNPVKAMPPWQELLSEDEARWIIRRLKTGLKDGRTEGGNVK